MLLRRRSHDDGPRTPPCEVEVVQTSYHPSRSELDEDMRVEAAFEESVQALARPVEIRCIPRPKSRR